MYDNASVCLSSHIERDERRRKKDSAERQLAAIRGFARRNGFEIVGEYYDPAINGADLVHQRPAFAQMLATIAGNGVRSIIVETASRFARDGRADAGLVCTDYCPIGARTAIPGL